MIYDDLMQAFAFLRMPGYETLCDDLYTKQNEAYRDICAYYTERYNALLPASDPRYDTIIPGKWYDMRSEDIDRRDAAQYLLTKWRDYESEARNAYRDCYDRLLALDDPGAACKVYELVVGAGIALRKAERCLDAEAD